MWVMCMFKHRIVAREPGLFFTRDTKIVARESVGSDRFLLVLGSVLEFIVFFIHTSGAVLREYDAQVAKLVDALP